MEASFLGAVQVSILSILVIFTVLTVLIFTIKLLVKVIPYEVPPAPAPRCQSALVNKEQDTHVAVITATLAMHLKKSPEDFQVSNISRSR